MLDLRGNPGGLLNVAVEIAERFIDSGLIVSTRGRAQGQTQVLSASGQARWRMPLFVLVDHDSASASEILAGALQDHHRATILGARTYGKGSVQSIFSLRSAPARSQAHHRQVLLALEPTLQRTRASSPTFPSPSASPPGRPPAKPPHRKKPRSATPSTTWFWPQPSAQPRASSRRRDEAPAGDSRNPGRGHDLSP